MNFMNIHKLISEFYHLVESLTEADFRPLEEAFRVELPLRCVALTTAIARPFHVVAEES